MSFKSGCGGYLPKSCLAPPRGLKTKGSIFLKTELSHVPENSRDDRGIKCDDPQVISGKTLFLIWRYGSMSFKSACGGYLPKSCLAPPRGQKPKGSLFS